MTENWAVCPGYSAYEVSDLGRVRRVKAGANNRYGNGTLRKPYPGPNGRLCLWMDGDDGQRRNIGVNRLVLLTFVGRPPTVDHEAAHWNGDPADNSRGNLRWATHAENEMDKVRHGTSNRGRRHRMCRLTEDDVRVIRQRLSAGDTLTPIAKTFSVSIGAIAGIRDGRSWTWV